MEINSELSRHYCIDCVIWVSYCVRYYGCDYRPYTKRHVETRFIKYND